MQQSFAIPFYACTWVSAQEQARQQYTCDWWVYDWSAVDYYWLYGVQFSWMQPQPDYSPLARSYFDSVQARIDTSTSEALGACESSRYPSAGTTDTGLRLTVASRVAQGQTRRVVTQSASALDQSGTSAQPNTVHLTAQFSVPFAPGSTPPPPSVCPPVPRELFSKPVSFGFTIYGPSADNMRWEWRNPQMPTVSGAYFDLYARTLAFEGVGGGGLLWFGELHLVVDRVADLWVEFASRPVPAQVSDRVNPNQKLDHQVSAGSGYYAVAAMLEVLHIESGQFYTTSLHGQGQALGYMPPYSPWPTAWDAMSMDANGVIRHGGIDKVFWMQSIDPDVSGLPRTGTYRMRYILLGRSYRTMERYVSSMVLGSGGDTRMSWKPIGLSVNPAMLSYTQGLTKGEIAPVEFTYSKSPELSQDIEFDAVFDMKYLTTFRFVMKVRNKLDFAVGVIVQAGGWQAWVRLEPGETKYLAGGVSVSGISNWNAYPLHPNSPTYGWNGNWGSSYISMNGGRCTIVFFLFLTAPTQPETLPQNLPAKKAGQRFYYDVSNWGPSYVPEWSEIKRYSSAGQYDHDFVISQYNASAHAIHQLYRSITQPNHQGLINPATYFVTGYATVLYDWSSPWHKRPWPGYSGWGGITAPIMCAGEQLTWNGTTNVWTAVSAITVYLTRAMMQQVASALDVTEYVVMDGADIRWFEPVTYSPPNYPESFSNVLWVDRFYTQAGASIDATAMRNAFQTVIANNAANWSNYRNLVVHAQVRFGSFLDNGGFEVGDYLLGSTGDMVEVISLDDLSSVSTKFLYHIAPAFQ